MKENEKKESLNDNESLITWQQAIGRDKTFENFQASNPSSVFEVNNIFWRITQDSGERVKMLQKLCFITGVDRGDREKKILDVNIDFVNDEPN